jgi:16S rRNA (uracil1498-N3)-methyltransferase
MLPRFLASNLDPCPGEVHLADDEAHHLARVLRLKIGDAVIVFDGRGHEADARVVSIARDRVGLTLTTALREAPAPSVALTLIQSVLKADAMDDVVRDCTMVGVAAIQPVISARTTVKTSLMAKAVDRWRRVALASAKQSGRATLPEILAPALFPDWLESGARAGDFLLVEPSVPDPGAIGIRDLANRPVPATARLIVGPEGGWTAEEVAHARGVGCVALSLGRLTLRADAVPLAASAALLALWER